VTLRWYVLVPRGCRAVDHTCYRNEHREQLYSVTSQLFTVMLQLLVELSLLYSYVATLVGDAEVSVFAAAPQPGPPQQDAPHRRRPPYILPSTILPSSSSTPGVFLQHRSDGPPRGTPVDAVVRTALRLVAPDPC
jgi:hypothetical protein